MRDLPIPGESSTIALRGIRKTMPNVTVSAPNLALPTRRRTWGPDERSTPAGGPELLAVAKPGTASTDW
jgi:hypothetical protein